MSHGSAAFAAECPIFKPMLRSVSPHTNRNVATSGYKKGTVLKSSGGGTPGTLLPYRTYSTHGRSYKTSSRPCGATNRRVDIECEGRTGRGFFLIEVAIQDNRLVMRGGDMPRYYGLGRMHEVAPACLTRSQ